MTRLERVAQFEAEEKQNRLDNVSRFEADERTKQHIKNQVGLAGTTEDEPDETNLFLDVLKTTNKYSSEASIGLYRGGLQSVTTAVSGLADVAGATSLKEWADDAEGYLEKLFATTTMVGDVAETVGRVGTGLLVTRGLGGTVKGSIAQGGLIDMLAFSGDEGNIADLLDAQGLSSGLTDWLKTSATDDEWLKRAKNGLQGAGLGAGVEGLVGMFKYGKKLYKAKYGNKFEGTDNELATILQDLVHKDADAIAKKQQEFYRTEDALKGVSKESPIKTKKLDVTERSVLTKQQEDLDQLVLNIDDKTLTIDSLKLNQAFKSQPQEVQQKILDALGTDEVFEVLGDVQQSISKLLKGQVDEAVEAPIKAIRGQTDEAIEVTKGVNNTTVKEVADLDEIEQLIKDADDFVAGVNKPLVDLKKPLNAPKLAEGNPQQFAEATRNIEANSGVKTHEETIADVDEALRDKIGDEAFNLMDDIFQTSKGLEGLDVKVGQQRVIVGTLAKALDDSVKLAQKDTTASSMMLVLNNLKNLNIASNTLKNSQTIVARTLSSMRINTANSQMMNTLKLLDAIDPDNAILRLEQSLGKNDQLALQKFIDDLGDTSKNLKEKIENIQDSLYTKITNSFSEGTVAGYISAPSTLAVNVIGNSLIKHQRLLQDTAQFVWGQTLRKGDRMGMDEYRHLLLSNVGQNFLDMKIISKNMLAWGRSGFKDEVFDNGVMIKFKQDQDFAHKYIDSKYWRGEQKGTGGAFNNAINIYGKLARSPYQVIGFVDDYYKRGAFRSELIRQGSRIASTKSLKGSQFDDFMFKFIHANTELRILSNQNKVPSKAWKVKNKDYVGTGDEGMFKYVDNATENANLMTFQKDLGEGLIGRGVKFLNSDGLLRTLIPFKLTPINILKHSISTATDPIRQILNGQIAKGGIHRDIALAKITTSVGILYGLSTLIASGRVTGTFTDEERLSMQDAIMPSLSVQIGDKWFEYKQLEPYATILGVMADLNKLKVNLDYRLDDATIEGTLEQEYMAVTADLALSLVHNISDKTYAKSLAEMLLVFNGESSLVDYSGKLLSAVSPLSSLTNYVGRVTNEGFKKEATTFTEKLQSKYRWLLERDALDSFGRPIKDTEYLYGFTLKVYDANSPENAGAREIARLGIHTKKMSKTISHNGLNVELTKEQYHKMRRSLDTEFKLSDLLNNQVNSQEYKDANDFVRERMLSSITATVRGNAMQLIKSTEPAILEGFSKATDLVVSKINRPANERTTYNDMIIGKVK